MGEISPPLFLSPLLSFFSYPSNIEIIFDFSDIITKIHPHFKILDLRLKSQPVEAFIIVRLYMYWALLKLAMVIFLFNTVNISYTESSFNFFTIISALQMLIKEQLFRSAKTSLNLDQS